MVQDLRLVDDVMNVRAVKPDRAARDQIRGNQGQDDRGPAPPPPPGAGPPPSLPSRRAPPPPQSLDNDNNNSDSDSDVNPSPPLRVACFIKMQELVQLVVLPGVIRMEIRVGIQEL